MAKELCSLGQKAAAIKAAVLLFHGSQDQNVGIGGSRLMASNLRAAGKQVELVEFEELTHGLVGRAARTRLLADSEAFLRRLLGMPVNQARTDRSAVMKSWQLSHR